MMKRLSLVAMLPVLSLAMPAAAESLAVLEKRCSEQERQIRQLEEENRQLRSLLETAERAKLEAEPKAVAKTSESTPEKKPEYYTVSPGDTLSRIARKHGTTTDVLVQLNKLKNAGLIRPGQKLLLPEKKANKTATVEQTPITKETPLEKVASTPSSRQGTHTVKDGETFFGIARKYGLSVDTLAEANPNANPRAIRVGQKLNLVAREGSERYALTETSAEASGTPPASDASTMPVTNKPLIRSVRIEEEINFGDFAAEHGMEAAKLNALNGLHLEPRTVLAKGSELYVSAQP